MLFVKLNISRLERVRAGEWDKREKTEMKSREMAIISTVA